MPTGTFDFNTYWASRPDLQDAYARAQAYGEGYANFPTQEAYAQNIWNIEQGLAPAPSNYNPSLTATNFSDPNPPTYNTPGTTYTPPNTTAPGTGTTGTGTGGTGTGGTGTGGTGTGGTGTGGTGTTGTGAGTGGTSAPGTGGTGTTTNPVPYPGATGPAATTPIGGGLIQAALPAINQNQTFDSAAYLAANPDVAAYIQANPGTMTAEQHWLQFGQAEGRPGGGQSPNIGGMVGVAGAGNIAPAQIANVGARTVGGDELVQNQVGNIIDADNPLMQQAETRGTQRAAQRGLINSTMGVQASQAALYDAALPIAAADAATYRGAGDQTYQANVARATEQAQLTQRAAETNASNNLEAQKTNAELAFRTQAANLDAATRTQLAEIEAQYRADMQVSSSATDLYTRGLAMITQVMQDPNMDAASKQASIDNIVSGIATGLDIIGSINGIDFGTLLDFA